MSRSYRHTSKRPYDHSASEKTYKIIWHRKMRAVIRQRLHYPDPDELLLPDHREIFNDWDFGKSGRIWFDARKHPEWMRK